MLLISSAINLGSVNIGRTRGRIRRKRGDFCIWASKKRKDFNGILGINDDDDDVSVVGSLIPEPDPICQSIHIPFQFSESSECVFKSKMRIPKRLSFSFSSNSTIVSVPLFSPSPEFLLYSHPAYRIPRFQSGVFVSKFSDCFLNRKRRSLWPTVRDCPVRYINTMAGIAANVRSSQFEGIDDVKSDENPSILSSRGYSEIAVGKKIFCNRSLNMKSIAAVGFDMDYTLAQYIPATFESLAYEGTVSKLVHDLGYPQELLKWTFDWKYMVRGLVIDKRRGNILKMDRHKYVKVAYHGFREMSKEEKVAAYGNNLVRDSFDEPDYGLIDTLFSLGAAYLFAQIVNFKDENPRKFPEGTDYSRIFKDIVFAVDLCHRDGTLKQMVAKDPKRYINEDSAIVPMLKILQKSGRKTFLVTNSLWDYTNVVMNFLCGPSAVDGSCALNFDWLQYFDIVITGSAKPGFFLDENRACLFEVDTESGMLLNTDNGTPMAQIGSTTLNMPEKSLNKDCRVFQGGNVGHLHKLLSIESSSQVLYVGDHIYGDILRSKKVLGWRTMLVVPELEKEVELLLKIKDRRKNLQLLRNNRDKIEDKIHHLKWSLKFDDNVKENIDSEIETLEVERDRVRLKHQQALREWHKEFHGVWGQLMRTGYQNSRFAHQVERFACLYSSQVTNLGLYSPEKYYRPSEDFMPHDFDIFPL